MSNLNAEFAIFDTWGKGIIPDCEHIFRCFRTPNTIAASWSAEYWKQILGDLLGRYERKLGPTPTIPTTRVQKEMILLEKRVLWSQMFVLLLALDHTPDEATQALKVKVALEALDQWHGCD